MRETASPDMILNRLRKCLNARSDSELARKLDVSQQSISSARTKDRVPDSWVRFAAERFGLSADWLLFGVGVPFFESGGIPEALPAHNPDAAISPPGIQPRKASRPERLFAKDGEIVMIPMVEARLSAGGGSFETSGSVERHYAFRTDFLRRKGQPSEMVLMRVDGDSMAPEIQNGDAVLIDCNQTGPRPGGIYAVGVEDLIYLKIVNAEPGKLILSSYNPAYAPIVVDTREQLESTVQIVGRVVWLGREFF